MFFAHVTGSIIVVVGSILLGIGYVTSEAIVSQPHTGHHFDATIWYLVIGVAGIIAGSILMLLESRD